MQFLFANSTSFMWVFQGKLVDFSSTYVYVRSHYVRIDYISFGGRTTLLPLKPHVLLLIIGGFFFFCSSINKVPSATHWGILMFSWNDGNVSSKNKTKTWKEKFSKFQFGNRQPGVHVGILKMIASKIRLFTFFWWNFYFLFKNALHKVALECKHWSLPI